MKRVIVDYRKLTPEVLSLLVDKYPHGYDDGHIISFKTPKNEVVEAVEVRTDDTIYLVKVSTSLKKSMHNFNLDLYADNDYNTPIIELPDNSQPDL